ncbi:MAG: hypothetical protein AAGJ37_00500 [Pseudomonadota bacterium]
MSQPQPQSPSVVNAFGKAIGVVCAFFATMPLYHASYPYFYRYALQYSHWDYHWLWEGLYIVCVFFMIVISVWMALFTVIGVLIAIPKALIALFTLWRY